MPNDSVEEGHTAISRVLVVVCWGGPCMSMKTTQSAVYGRLAPDSKLLESPYAVKQLEALAVWAGT